MSQTTRSVTTEQLGAFRERLGSSDAVALEPVTAAIALQVPLVTRDSAVRASALVRTIW
ncbi:MAG: hypothetical protein ABSE77_21795 [Acidimicrobiales bacterium]